MSRVAVSAIITAHHEKEMLIPAIESLNAASELLLESGVDVEKIIICDCPDAGTTKIVEQQTKGHDFIVHMVEFADQGKSRNFAIESARGEFIAFLDGDDLWSENWLYEAYQQATSCEDKPVIYPEFNWFFEGSENVLCQTDERFAYFDVEALRTVNLWDALCFCPRDIYLQIPFAGRQIKAGFAYEDWNWNRRVMEAGHSQLVAKNTIIFKRRRLGSQGAEAAKRGVMAKPTASSFYAYWESFFE
jgi:glycosyltransferase involved in cell wall biosynthesis